MRKDELIEDEWYLLQYERESTGEKMWTISQCEYLWHEKGRFLSFDGFSENDPSLIQQIKIPMLE